MPFESSLLSFIHSWLFSKPCCLSLIGHNTVLLLTLFQSTHLESSRNYVLIPQVDYLSIGVENTGCKRQMIIKLNIAVHCRETQESRKC